jgi:DAACS family dicarboxylate/amino acid:cation (Na+ or H+) symporter/aerobic C4-dicarboxylate transport protein
MIGNSVAAIVVAKWEGQFDLARARRVLSRHEDDLPIPLPAANPAAA